MRMQILDRDPDLEVGDLRLWIHGRQFPDARDYWDGNWLNVTAQCRAQCAAVEAGGAIVHLPELVSFGNACARLYDTLEGAASLDCMEPNLSVALQARTGGHIDIVIEITPDHMSQRHRFSDTIDQTYLPDIVSACRRIVERFPVREAERLPKGV
jgi:hypothetical protein